MKAISSGEELEETVLSILELLSNVRGYYVLLIYVKVDVRISIGKLGVKRFEKGYYVYIGSALGKGAVSLGGRIRRHVRKQKTKMWHIDYLLFNKNAIVKTVVAGVAGQKMECRITKRLKEVFHGQTPVVGFGASDCKDNCRSHLLYIKRAHSIVDMIIDLLLREFDGEIYVLRLR